MCVRARACVCVCAARHIVCEEEVIVCEEADLALHDREFNVSHEHRVKRDLV